MHDAIKMMESKMTPESVARSRLMAEQEILAIRLGQYPSSPSPRSENKSLKAVGAQ
ncbi:MAG: hypothetical protein LBB74_10565 [Chitinispirillales bacterium]|jgi:hypothetical protein|nr:hypothetical protein [Chitinispirillales bacterium]